jgi:TRAP-type mannitol/chloroaromatic compound transport system substrate-binding protein
MSETPSAAGRRGVLAGAAVATAAATATLSTPALSQGRIEWRMVTGWPRGLPGVATGADKLAQRIGEMSDGRLTVRVFHAGELVGAFAGMDAVMQGTAEMCHDGSFYHLGKSRTLALFSNVPYGLTSSENMAWILHGGGLQLWNELNARFGCISFPCASTSAQAFGWFRREINSPADFRGLRMRIPGLGGEVFREMGGAGIAMPAGEIFQALQSGTVDAAEFIGPWVDRALGLQQVAKICYGPGVNEPGTILQCLMNRSRYEALPRDLQRIIEIACYAGHEDMKTEYDFRHGQVMEEMRTRDGVRFLRLSNDILTALGQASQRVVTREFEQADELGRRIWVSHMQARATLRRYIDFNERSFMNARSLQFPYTVPGA